MTEIGVIVNEGKVLGAGLEELRASLANAGFADPPWHEVPKSRKAPDKIRELVDRGVDRVLVWGGDGTVQRTVQTLLDDGTDHVSIGVLPAGTANLLARNLGIPIDLHGALDIALEGDPRPIDVGLMNGRYFTVMGGTGFDALLIADTDGGLKDRLGQLGYVWASLRHTRISPTEVEIIVDGRTWYDGKANCVLTVNVGTILGGVEAFPDASPADGRLDIGVIETRTTSDWVGLLARAAVGRGHRSPVAKMTSGCEITVRSVRGLPWEVDGGDEGRADRFDVSVVPAAIQVCQPPADRA